MSEYPTDVKQPLDAELPIYRIDESNVELAVGGESRRCRFRNFFARRCCRSNDAAKERKRSCARRLVRWVVAIALFVGLSSLFIRHKIHHHMKMHPVVCVPLEEASSTLQLPLANRRTHVGLHPSLTGGDTHIIHSEEIKEGSVEFSFDLPKDTKLFDDEENPELYVCHIAGPHFVGVGVHSKKEGEKHAHHHKHGRHGKHALINATSTTVKLSQAEAGHARGVNLLGPRFRRGHRGFMRRIMKKAVRKAIRKAIREAAWVKVHRAEVE